MGKNVIVIDEQGNEYEATYPKRAKGLVKSGRARFVGDNKICLACPPNINLEDKKMTENKNINATQNTSEITETEVWAQITRLQESLISIQETADNILSIDTMGDCVTSPCKELAVEQIKAIQAVFCEREKTLNSLLDFYKIVYNDMYQSKKNAKNDNIEK